MKTKPVAKIEVGDLLSLEVNGRLLDVRVEKSSDLKVSVLDKRAYSGEEVRAALVALLDRLGPVQDGNSWSVGIADDEVCIWSQQRGVLLTVKVEQPLAKERP